MHHDDTELFPDQLLNDHVKVANRRSIAALAKTALRTRSLSARHILARAAGGPGSSLDDVIGAARRGSTTGLATGQMNPGRMAQLGRVVALQQALPDDLSDGLAVYNLALDLAGPRKIEAIDQAIHPELAFLAGDRKLAHRLLQRYRRVPEHNRATLLMDLANPFLSVGEGDHDDWLRRFGEFFPEPRPMLSGDTAAVAFDRVTTAEVPPIDDGPLISVIITSYRPGEELLHSLRSILAQSWRRVEVLLVDDASPHEHEALLRRCTELDERVKLIRMDVNGGTYLARNAGLDAAQGEFITFHDSDDWAHPVRLRRQVEELLAEPELMATLSDGLVVTDDLMVTRPGRKSLNVYTPTLMFRRAEVMERIGYLDSVRKSADTEYHLRISAAFGAASVRRIEGTAYSLVRQTPGSLSRDEFRATWIHPARHAYRSAYGPWHRQIADGTADPYLPRKLETRPFAAPRRYRVDGPGEPRGYDVVYACEWRRFGGPQKSMMEEIAALTRRGMRVGIMHMESYRHMTHQQMPLCEPIQQLINDGTVDHVLRTDTAHTELLVIRYPPVLQFLTHDPYEVSARRVIVLANQSPTERDGSDMRYLPASCSRAVREAFKVEPMWCPQGPAVRAALEPLLPAEALTEFDMQGLIDESQWSRPRTGFRSTVPVIGRHSRDGWVKWPTDAKTLLQIYPDTTEVDVRIMGGTTAVCELLGTETAPARWLCYQYDEVEVQQFLNQLDFYVYFPHPVMIEAFGRAILEALAAGCVVILPHHFEETFGDAALYCKPEEVRDVIRHYYSSKQRFLTQSKRAQRRVRQRHSHESYHQQICELLDRRPTAHIVE